MYLFCNLCWFASSKYSEATLIGALIAKFCTPCRSLPAFCPPTTLPSLPLKASPASAPVRKSCGNSSCIMPYMLLAIWLSSYPCFFRSSYNPPAFIRAVVGPPANAQCSICAAVLPPRALPALLRPAAIVLPA